MTEQAPNIHQEEMLNSIDAAREATQAAGMYSEQVFGQATDMTGHQEFIN